MVNQKYHITQRTTKLNDLYKKEPSVDVMALNKIYIGKVRDSRDPQNMGRILVWIPELTSNQDDPDGWYVASYCSPFAGTSFLDVKLYNDVEGNNSVKYQRDITDPDRQPDNPEDELGGRQSYGMWFTPPDIGNDVIVTFVRGDSTSCIWMGSMYGQHLNNMVPGIASAEVADAGETDDSVGPSIETDLRVENNLTNATPPRKKYSPLFDGLKRQGLNTDFQRGNSTSGARRESPSQVFGILTPNGNQFVMDDGTENLTDDPTHPGGNALIRLRTKSGTQLLLDDTDGSIYAVSRDGKTWIELNSDGNVDIYGKTNISVHAETGNINLKTSGEEGDINIQSSRDINIEAERNLRLEVGGETDILSNNDITIATAEKMHITSVLDMAIEVRSGALGISAAYDINVQTPGGAFTAAAANKMTLFTNAEMDIGASGNIAMESGAEVGVTSVGVTSITATGNADIQGAQVLLNDPGHVNGPLPGTPPAIGPKPDLPETPVTHDNVPSQATSDDEEAGPWTAGEPYETYTNIIPRVPQHEPWGARSTKDAAGTNGIVVQTETNAKEGSTSSTADVPDNYVDSDGNVHDGVGYGADGKPSHVVNSILSSPSLTNPPANYAASDDVKGIVKKYETPNNKTTTDAAGRSTIGYGHTLTEQEIVDKTFDDVTLDQSAMDSLLDGDIIKAAGTVISSIKTNITQGQFDSMTSLSMNIGPSEFANSDVVKSVNLQKLSAVPTLMTRWSSIRTTGLPKLPSLPSIAGLPNLPSLPGLPKIPGLPSLPTAPTLPGVPSLPGAPGLPTTGGDSALASIKRSVQTIVTPLAGLTNRRAEEAKVFAKVPKPPTI